MALRKLPRRRLEPGETLVEQGAQEDELYLLLDGVLDVEVDGAVVAQVGPGAMLGERAAIEGGTRTATLRAVTPCRLAVISPEQISKYELTELALTRRREEP
jgi:CRP-like cAMP-binding protein